MEERSPMSVATLRRLMIDRSIRAYLAQRRNERRADRSPMGLALAKVMADRRGSDWGWLDQDSSLRRA